MAFKGLSNIPAVSSLNGDHDRAVGPMEQNTTSPQPKVNRVSGHRPEPSAFGKLPVNGAGSEACDALAALASATSPLQLKLSNFHSIDNSGQPPVADAVW